MERLKFTALASRAPGTSISYTTVFNRWRSFAADVLDIFSFELNQKLKVMMRVSRASGTSEYYLRPFDRWAEFARGVLGVPAFPVGPMDCALHLQFLLQSSSSASAINCAFYTFKWLHLVAEVDSPTLHPTVIFAKEGSLRLLSQPASHRKETLEVTHLKKLAERTDFGNLSQLRRMFVLAFSGFSRGSELC